ncbi:hypothetical protein F5876DRAFT_84203 [Lentinula aff. lateritia]|uniref:Uncharacterized protein n=1 Tax=Lentinula aff. lateritia TaxID=2804960 RepID=A0ACC1TGX0_9AGAR|nr:hypothetical protein F5876DRAFT_84203 [Lentinula aff. lateritia]
MYRTNKGVETKWSPPCGPEAQCPLKELVPVFNHPITKVWNDDLGWEAVKVMDVHEIRFTTIDVIGFKVDEVSEDDEDNECSGEARYSVLSPVTIWVGVFPGLVTATAAHNVAKIILDLLKVYQIADVDIEFHKSLYISNAGPQLFKAVDAKDPLVNVVSPLTPLLGLQISTRARPDSQGTMALYLNKGDGSDDLLGLSCCHVLIGNQEANFDYMYHCSSPSKDVLLFRNRAYKDIVEATKASISHYTLAAQCSKNTIKGSEKDANTVHDETKVNQSDVGSSLAETEKVLKAFRTLNYQIKSNWKTLDSRVLGQIVFSPALRFGVGEHYFMEDWGLFSIKHTKLGARFSGNKIDLGTKSSKFKDHCFPQIDATWHFQYPDGHLLPLRGVIPNSLMQHPDMWDSDHEPCLLVVKNGHATGTTFGHANGPFLVVRTYPLDMLTQHTSMEWGILNYDSKSEVFLNSSDSGSIIADIRGQIGGMLTGGAGSTDSSDLTYATSFWWLLKHIKANGFCKVHLDVAA